MLMVVICPDRLSRCAEAHDAPGSRTRAMWTWCSVQRPDVGQAKGPLGVRHWTGPHLVLPIPASSHASCPGCTC
jgi:hypothetical protein